MNNYTNYAENIEPLAMEQFLSAMEQDFVVRGALMPDAHAGYSLPIGAVVATDGVVVPAWVGYDIGCGMCAVKTSFNPEDIRQRAGVIFEALYQTIPLGFNHHKTNQEWDCRPQGTEVCEAIFSKNGLRQLGTLGGGNHFIEIGEDEDNEVWVIIHSGSRGIGHAVATHYMKLASGTDKAKEGHFAFDVISANGRDYLTDMNFCLSFALENRQQIISEAIYQMQRFCVGTITSGALINRNHNHAEYKDGVWVHRKGATHAEEGMLGVIPGNMRDGSFIVRGKGNPESLWSSSHGAGRVMGRKKAKETLDVQEFAAEMSSVYAKVDGSTLDEAPGAYKNIFAVMEAQKDLVEVVHHIKPIINIKG